MMFVIVRTSDALYVARSGSKHSYTSRLDQAQVFTSRDVAEAHRCVENEVVRSVEEIMHTGSPL